jgi:hypothetical protein
MAAEEIGALRVALSANAAQFDADMKAAAKAVKGASGQMQQDLGGFQAKMQAIGGSIKDFSKNVAKIGAGLSAAVTAPLALFGKSSLSAYQESEKAVASMEATLASMGDASGKTSEQLQGLAAHLQSISTVDDDKILQESIGQLLTFGTIAGQEFDRAAKAALDLSQKLGGDLQGATIMVGKALNDPVRGLTALQRVGIQFTQEQKDLIKGFVETGEVTKAQGIILEELERQFGGVAEAMAGTSEGQVEQLTNQWGDFKETIGQIVAEFLPPLVGFLKDVVVGLQGMDPETRKAIVVMGGLAAAIGPVLAILGTLGMALGALVAVGTGPILMVAGAVTGLIVVWKRWDEIKVIVQNMVEGVRTWLLGPLMDAFNTVKTAIEDVKGWFKGMYDAVVGHSYVPDMVRGVQDWFGRMAKSMEEETTRGTEAVDRQMMIMQRAGENASYSLGQGFRGLIKDGNSFSDVLANLTDQLADIAMRWGLESMSANGGNWGFLSAALGGLFGFADGGSFTVGGAGGTDSQTVAFRATPGEHVSVSTPEQMKRGGGDTYVIDARGADKEGLRRLETMIQQVNGSVEHRAVGAVALEAQRSAGFRQALGSR